MADEVFLTGTAAEIIPIIEIDARMIGSGKPGVITKKFLKEFHQQVQQDAQANDWVSPFAPQT